MNSKTFKSEKDWIEAAVSHILEVAPKTIALCGGNTVQPIYQALSQTPLAKQAEFFQTDERYIPADHEDSNQKMIREILKPTNFTTFDTKLPIEEALGDYAKKLPQSFDLIILAIGPDGHIASLFPDTPESKTPVAHTQAPPQFKVKNRLTLTYKTIEAAKHILLLAKNRDEILKRLEDILLPANKIINKSTQIYSFSSELK